MIFATAFIALLISILHAAATAGPLRHPDCVAELVAFSPCLPYVSASPNNFIATVPLQCCDAISSAFNSTGDYCLFFLLRHPVIFGFPLNVSRVLSLSPVCSVRTCTSLEPTSHSGAQQLSPLPGNTNPEVSHPSHSFADNAPSPASISVPITFSSPPSSTERPPKPIISSGNVSLAMAQMNNNGWYAPGVPIILSYILM